MSVEYLKDAAARGENDKLIRFVRLHLGDGDETVGKREIDKAWTEALKLLLAAGPTNRAFILGALEEQTPATLAHLFLQRRMIVEALDHLVTARESGQVRVVPIAWSDARREGRTIERSLGIR